MSRHGATTVVFFGLLIGTVLVGAQFAAVLWMPARPFDGYAGGIGALFLIVGLLVGLRDRAGSRHPPARRSSGGETVAPIATPAPHEPPWVATDSPAQLLESLSPRELEILASLAVGYSNAEIAERHCVSLNTVKTHLRQIYGKLQVTRRVQAVARARQLGLLQ